MPDKMIQIKVTETIEYTFEVPYDALAEVGGDDFGGELAELEGETYGDLDNYLADQCAANTAKSAVVVRELEIIQGVA